MAKLNMALVKEQLAAAKRTVKKSTSNQNSRMKELIWKPDEGENLIRIVPNQFQEGTPFIKLTFHYQFTANINGEEKNVTYISPSNFGKADPVIELSRDFRNMETENCGDKESNLNQRPEPMFPL